MVSTEIAYPHVTKPQGGTARLQRLPRIRVAQIVMDQMAYGWSAEEILRQHPYLKPAEVHAALGYYFDHQSEIESEIAAEWREICAVNGSPDSAFVVRMRAKGIL